MAVDIEAIESIERQMEALRTAGVSGVMVTAKAEKRPKPAQLEISIQMCGKPAVITATPVEIVDMSNGVEARAIRFVLVREGCPNDQSRTAVFSPPAIVTDEGILRQVCVSKRGKRAPTLEPFDPRNIFSGIQKVQKALKSQGVTFR